MRWTKIGFFPVPHGAGAWAASHCQLPTALPLAQDRVRIFFASRDSSQRSHVGCTDLRLTDGGNAFVIEEVASEAILSPGQVGHFDEHGVFPSCVVPRDGDYLMYYIGWTRGVEPPLFYASIGLAVSRDGRSFTRFSRAPIMARSEHDPCLVTSPHVYVDAGRWVMSYVSGVAWSRDPSGHLRSHYHIKLAESSDGIEWQRHGKVAIDFLDGETNIARPAVRKCPRVGFQMWYCRTDLEAGKYRMGYAESPDGELWHRRDHLAGIGLDEVHAREMVCYPCVFALGANVYMAYNGDEFGRSGFCVARQVDVQ